MAFRLTVDPSTREVIRKTERKVEKAHEGATQMLALDVWGNLGEEAPKDHGRLAGSFTIDRFGVLSWRVGTGVEYAEDVWRGTQPHVIEPVDASVLRFTVDGSFVYARRVDHPGTQPNDYVGRAKKASERRRDDFIATQLSKVGL